MKAWMPPRNTVSKSFQTTSRIDGEHAADRDVAGARRHQRADQGEHDAAGEDVAEESQGQRDRLESSSRMFSGSRIGIRLQEVLEVALRALLPDAVDPDADDHHERHRVGQVGVGRRRGQQVDVLVELGRDDLEPVRDQDEEEQRDRQRHDVGVDLAEVVLDLGLHLVDDRLPDQLELGRDVVLGVLGQLAASPEAEQRARSARRPRSPRSCRG